MILQKLKELLSLGRQTTSAPLRPRLELPDNYSVIYAIGDIHGRLDLLRSLEKKIITDGDLVDGKKLIIQLGDLIDRGPHSAQTIDHFLSPPPPNWERRALAGNHEATFHDALHNPKLFERWLGFGGLETLGSYGIGQREIQNALGSARGITHLLAANIPSEHIDFIAQLPVSITAGPLLFSHAGARPGVPFERQEEHDLLWYKGSRDNIQTDGRIIIHGHEIVAQAEIHAGRINIDTGAYRSGTLTAVRLQPGTMTQIILVNTTT